MIIVADSALWPSRARSKREWSDAHDAALASLPSATVRGTTRVRVLKGMGFDRKAYQAQKARARRAKLKAEGNPQ